MSLDLQFPHHTFQDGEVPGPYSLVPATEAQAVSDPRPAHVRDATDKLRSANVSAVILVHGTFTGNDIAGLVRELARLSPRLADKARSLGKTIVDHLAGDVGNYTKSFTDKLSSLLNCDQQPVIPVTCFHWSGENHHLGRAGGMVSLLDLLTSDSQYLGRRLLVWAHSHGGNLLAMASLLVGATPQAREAFFDATRPHYRDPILRRLDLPQWETIRQRLLDESIVQAFPRLDVVDFGTPLRYRWDRTVCANLLHFVQHRSLDSDGPELASIPRSVQEVRSAAAGDYVQHLGVGGTDFLHSAFAWRSWNVERRLRKMFERSIRRRDLLMRLKQCRRISSDGTTLLVDYPETDGKWNQSLLGHGVYTRHEWIPFHLNSIASRFYTTDDRS